MYWGVADTRARPGLECGEEWPWVEKSSGIEDMVDIEDMEREGMEEPRVVDRLGNLQLAWG